MPDNFSSLKNFVPVSMFGSFIGQLHTPTFRALNIYCARHRALTTLVLRKDAVENRVINLTYVGAHKYLTREFGSDNLENLLECSCRVRQLL